MKRFRNLWGKRLRRNFQQTFLPVVTTAHLKSWTWQLATDWQPGAHLIKVSHPRLHFMDLSHIEVLHSSFRLQPNPQIFLLYTWKGSLQSWQQFNGPLNLLTFRSKHVRCSLCTEYWHCVLRLCTDTAHCLSGGPRFNKKGPGQTPKPLFWFLFPISENVDV